jgi:NTP pyrophosphatase (non-canonical NTP hydrolase)
MISNRYLETRAAHDVAEERVRQDQKWGEQNHDPLTYLNILMEEVGEASQAAIQTRFGGDRGGLEHLREEAVHTAAVALAIVECLDRGKWKWSDPDFIQQKEIIRLREYLQRIYDQSSEDLRQGLGYRTNLHQIEADARAALRISGADTTKSG